MSEEIEPKGHSSDPDEALTRLTRHLARTRSAELETLALQRSTCFAAELHRCATLQLRAVWRLPGRLAELEARAADERLDPGLRPGLRVILRGIRQMVLLDRPEVEAQLGPTLALELLLVHLRPWLPQAMVQPHSEALHHVLRLGLSARRLAWIEAQVAGMRRRFYRACALEPGAPEHPLGVDSGELERLSVEARVEHVSPSISCRRGPEHDAPIPRPLAETGSLELFG